MCRPLWVFWPQSPLAWSGLFFSNKLFIKKEKERRRETEKERKTHMVADCGSTGQISLVWTTSLANYHQESAVVGHTQFHSAEDGWPFKLLCYQRHIKRKRESESIEITSCTTQTKANKTQLKLLSSSKNTSEILQDGTRATSVELKRWSAQLAWNSSMQSHMLRAPSCPMGQAAQGQVHILSS